MRCLDCDTQGVVSEVIGLCHHSSAGLCAKHAHVRERGVTAQFPIVKTIVLPVRARELLCGVCEAALEQPHLQVSA